MMIRFLILDYPLPDPKILHDGRWTTTDLVVLYKLSRLASLAGSTNFTCFINELNKLDTKTIHYLSRPFPSDEVLSEDAGAELFHFREKLGIWIITQLLESGLENITAEKQVMTLETMDEILKLDW